MKLIFFAHFGGFRIYTRDLPGSNPNINTDNISGKIDFSVIAAKEDNVICSKTIDNGRLLHFIGIYSRITESGSTPRPSNIGVGLLTDKKISEVKIKLEVLELLKGEFIKQVSDNGVKLKNNLSAGAIEIIIDNIINHNFSKVSGITNGNRLVEKPSFYHSNKTKAVIQTGSLSSSELLKAMEIQQEMFSEIYLIKDLMHADYENKFNRPEIIIGKIENGNFAPLQLPASKMNLPLPTKETVVSGFPQEPKSGNAEIISRLEHDKDRLRDKLKTQQSRTQSWKTYTAIAASLAGLFFFGGIGIYFMGNHKPAGTSGNAYNSNTVLPQQIEIDSEAVVGLFAENHIEKVDSIIKEAKANVSTAGIQNTLISETDSVRQKLLVEMRNMDKKASVIKTAYNEIERKAIKFPNDHEIKTLLKRLGSKIETVKEEAGEKVIPKSSGETTTITPDRKKAEKKPSVIPVKVQKQKKPDNKRDTKNTIEEPVKESSGETLDQSKQIRKDDKTGMSTVNNNVNDTSEKGK